MSRPAAVIVLAAGKGTRMKSAHPKVVHPVAGLSMIGHALRAGAALEPDHLVAVVRHERERVVEEITAVMPQTFIADQDDIPGTGRAVQCALEALTAAHGAPAGTVVVTSGDVPMLAPDTLTALVATHEEGGHAVTILTSIAPDPTGYGRILRGSDGTVTGIVEQRDATDEQRAITEVNAGVYAFDGGFLAQTLSTLGTDNDQGEVYLTDVVSAAVAAGRTATALVLDDSWQAEGCNDRVQLAALGAEFNRRICETHMREGVTIVDPASTWIECDVRIGADTIIEPNTYLRGKTVIGSNCVIGPHTTLTSVEVGDGSVLPATWGSDEVLPADTIGTPFRVLGQVTTH